MQEESLVIICTCVTTLSLMSSTIMAFVFLWNRMLFQLTLNSERLLVLVKNTLYIENFDFKAGATVILKILTLGLVIRWGQQLHYRCDWRTNLLSSTVIGSRLSYFLHKCCIKSDCVHGFLKRYRFDLLLMLKHVISLTWWAQLFLWEGHVTVFDNKKGDKLANLNYLPVGI